MACRLSRVADSDSCRQSTSLVVIYSISINVGEGIYLCRGDMDSVFVLFHQYLSAGIYSANAQRRT